ncbi:MAG TPA: uroporphyrinogen-III synthase, partial [Kofleriaceae bacterium]|nr:uroporphyrinogen-III synthase [Kofleriaceae bacterium]
GRKPDEPVAVIESGTLLRQRTLTGTLGDIVEKSAAAGIRPPALTVVGEVVRLRERIAWFEALPLRGRRVLALSTHDQPPAVDAQGAEIVHVSPLTVVPRFADVKARLGKLSEIRAIAVTSRHGVDALVGGLVALGHDARALAGIKLAAVGEATARRFEALQLRADLVGSGGGAELAQEIAAAGWEGPVLVLRAAGGREELPAALAAAGYAALVVDAYDTIPDDGALNRALKQHRVQPFDAVAFSSPKGAEAFLELAGGGKALGSALVGAIGETTRAALAAAGVTATVVPDRPELARLLEALLDRLAKVP